ncbi:amino acid adenylation domain-containing protein [Erwinia sp. E602]|uniref:non-ribosomal peptide synthetase n=1 Tax=Erwinia sp. E602 TaxID=2675378 RepID=UPI001BA9AD44|nr:non-ribosomal peptide synthetase [Erwinia sp. E602]QUG77202.1 amino acid adenylation domain-containing protein [Erwinia sp. E602]
MSNYPLTSVQQAVWLDQLLTPETPCYNVGTLWRIERDIDIQLFNKAINQTLAEHDALRTRLEESESGIVQTTVPTKDIHLEYHNFSQEKEAAAKARYFLKERFNSPFKLYDELLWRCLMIKTDENHHLWLISAHHLIADGTSISLLSATIVERYKKLKSGVQADDGPIVGYGEFIANDCAYQTSTRYERDRAFWLSRFSDVQLHPLERRPGYETAGPCPSQQINRHLSLAAFARLSALSAAHGCSPMHLMVALLACWSARLKQVDEAIIGIPVHNRSGAQHKQTLGMFSSMIPLRLQIDHRQPFSALMQQIAAELRRCYRHQRFPVAELNRHLKLGQQGRRQLFDLSFSLEVFPTDIELEGSRLKVEIMHHGFEQLPLGVYLRHYHPQDEPLVEFNFNQAWFSAEQAERSANRLMQMLAHVLDSNAEVPLATIPLLLPDEQQRVFGQWNQTDRRWLLPGGIHRWFEQQVLRTPDAPALCGEGLALSYLSLNQQANQLAAQLRVSGVVPDQRVALCAARSAEMVVALLAILKAGGAYVPLDPDYPADRLRHMIGDCGARLALLDDAGEQALLPLLPADIHHYHLQRDAHRWQTLPQDNLPDVAEQPQRSLAYVIYTSGSTGKPKGVMNEHLGVMNRLQWMQQQYQLTAADTVLQKTPFSFDVSVWEFFWPLMVGARLAIARPGGHQDPDYLSAFIAEQRVTTLHFVPSMLQLFLRHAEMAQCASLKKVMCSGEALPLTVVQRFYQLLPAAELHNLYGPTEAAVDVSYWHCRADDAQVPIGRPVANTRLYILDRQLQPLPPGTHGELHIGGVQVARGYLNRAELNAERFIADPFSNDPAARLYKTGDLARRLPDGSIEYLGRNDFQVKIHGVRIELGEIEQQLLALEGVEDAVVSACDDGHGDKRLVAWLVAAEQHVQAESLRQQLKKVMPESMIPALFIPLQALPLSPNGKLDRNALPQPTLQPLQRAWQAPEGEDECQLAALWQEILQVDRVGRDDDFFALGGHSLHAIQLMVRLKRDGVALQMKNLFAHATLSAQAEMITQRRIQPTTDASAATPLPLQKLLLQLNQPPQAFRLTQRLNPPTAGGEVWMVHPAVVGCEIYRELADALTGQLNAIGVNNYNLFHQPPIASLSALAGYYLQHLLTEGTPPDQPIRLLGWSLGGVIALEMASQLEQRGYRNIHLCLLDSLYQTPLQQRIVPGMLAPILAMLGIEGEAAERALRAEATELAMNNQPLSAPLCHSRVTLFKATEFADLSLEGMDGAELLAITDNGLGQICSQLQVIPLAASHHSIILCHEAIRAALLPPRPLTRTTAA